MYIESWFELPPVFLWWAFLVGVSALNVTLWCVILRRLHLSRGFAAGLIRVELMVMLCGAYVFGCAFRSVLPRADVQRICLFDTWLSSVAVGRSVATVAEICFVIQWAIVLRQLGRMTHSDTVLNISRLIVPLIVLAECCSWYAVLTTNYLGNSIENSLWAVSFVLITVALIRLVPEFRGLARAAIVITGAGVAAYLGFLVLVDVPMYFARWEMDLATGKTLLGILSGWHDVTTHWAVTDDFSQWRDEMAWMGLYFSVGVWSSLALCSFELVKHWLPQYRRDIRRSGASIQPVAIAS